MQTKSIPELVPEAMFLAQPTAGYRIKTINKNESQAIRRRKVNKFGSELV